jgi:GTP pyrophosphokinase
MMLPRMTFLKDAENRETFLKRIAQFYPTLDSRYQEIERAYDTAKTAFRGKFREDGTRYFEHLRAVALIMIVWLRIKDHRLIIAGLLHDLVEDDPKWTIARVQIEFGNEVACWLEWVSKPGMKGYRSKEERDDWYHQRMKNAPREVFLIKLPDRLHNTITLWGCSVEKRLRKIAETKLHYLPFAEDHQILYHELVEALAILEKPKRRASRRR